jgi:putative membrane protein
VVSTASLVFTALVALLHAYFLVLEMFLWTTPYAQKNFGRTQKEQEDTKVLAANQGLYNGFLAAGLVWSLIASEPTAYTARLFFLTCVLIAGLYGAATASRKILFAQAMPALLALVVTWLAYH